MTQGSFWPEDQEPDDICRNRHGGESFSEAANRSAEPHKSLQRRLVLGFIRANGDATTFEVHEGLEIPYTAASARMTELKRESAIVPVVIDGIRISRLTGFGRKAGVYKACDPGLSGLES